MLNFNSFHDYSQFSQIQQHQKRLTVSPSVLPPHSSFAYTQQTQSIILPSTQCRVYTGHAYYAIPVYLQHFIQNSLGIFHSLHILLLFAIATTTETKKKFNTIFIFFTSILNVDAGTCVHQTVCMQNKQQSGKYVWSASEHSLLVWVCVNVCPCVGEKCFIQRKNFGIFCCLAVAFSQSDNIFFLILFLSRSHSLLVGYNHLPYPLPIIWTLAKSVNNKWH